MSLLEELNSPDDRVRLAAARSAHDGGPELVGALLDLALHDPAEVRTTGGIAEVWENVSDAAAQSLGRIVTRHDGVDDRIRAAVRDPAEDGGRVSRLLYHLGERYEPVRRELERSEDGALRVRALRAVLPQRRPAELTRRFLADPHPAARVEALQGGTGLTLAELEAPLRDPSPEVRLAAARKLRGVPDSAAYVAAARTETDPKVRQAYVEGLTGRPLTDDVRRALTGYLADDDHYTAPMAARRLHRAGDPGTAAAIASRVLVQTDEGDLAPLLEHPYLLVHVPELAEPLEHLQRCTPDGRLRHVLREMLKDGRPEYAPDNPADGLDAVRRARLLREVLGWACHALESGAGDGLRAWLAAPDDRTAAEWITDHDWFGTGATAELLHAAVDGDLRRASAVEVPPLLRLAYLCTARQLRAGLDPLPPAPLSPMLARGPDALRVRFHRGAPAVLGLRETVVLRTVFRPEHAVLCVACPGCGATVRTEGPVERCYRDDDRVAESEDGFAGTLTGTCARCGTGAGTRILLSVTEHRFDRSRALTWDTRS